MWSVVFFGGSLSALVCERDSFVVFELVEPGSC